MKLFFLLAVTFLVGACGQNNERLKEKSQMERESQLRVENEGLSKKAEAMETDLTRRHRFYQAVKGVYEGSISTNLGTFNIRLTLSPSLPPVRTTRIRQLEEIASDLNGLTLNTQVVQWDPNNSNASVGCPGTAVKPDIEKGEIIIPSSELCKNLYIIKISERGFVGTSIENNVTALRVSTQVLKGDLNEIDSLTGTIQPSTNASVFKFVAHKVQE